MAGLLEYVKNGQVTEPPLYRFMKGNVQSFLNSIPDPSKMTPEQQLAMSLNANPIMGLLGTTAYHGTGQDIKQFLPNTFFTKDPEAASSYALDRGYGGGANVIPVDITAKKLANNEDIINIAKKLKIYADDKHIYEYISPNVDKNAEKVISELKKKKFEGAKFSDWDMNNNEIESLLVFDPNKVNFLTQQKGLLK